MRERRSGTIVQISSVGGLTAAPGFGPYCAAQHALEGLSECLAPFGARVLIVEPGAFRTKLFGGAFRTMPALDAYAATVGPLRAWAGSTDGSQAGDPVTAARAIVDAVAAGAPTLRLPPGADAVKRIREKLVRSRPTWIGRSAWPARRRSNLPSRRRAAASRTMRALGWATVLRPPATRQPAPATTAVNTSAAFVALRLPREWTMTVHHRYAKVAGLDIFYREAGPVDGPVVLLLHGFPTSSHMFRDLIPRLADRFRLIAPDYPGFGYSTAPSPLELEYTFERLADVMVGFVDALGLRRYALYQQDFGGPIGFRVAARHPERVVAHVIQNANAYVEGLTAALHDVVLKIWSVRTPETEARLRALFELDVTQRQFLEGAHDPSLVSPDAWQHAQWGMDRPGNKQIQFALHADYQANVHAYPRWHAYMRAKQPPVLVVWGKHDFVFAPAGAAAYRQDVPTAEIHMLDAGHFALETRCDEIAAHMRRFLGKLSDPGEIAL